MTFVTVTMRGPISFLTEEDKEEIEKERVYRATLDDTYCRQSTHGLDCPKATHVVNLALGNVSMLNVPVCDNCLARVDEYITKSKKIKGAKK